MRVLVPGLKVDCCLCPKASVHPKRPCETNSIPHSDPELLSEDVGSDEAALRILQVQKNAESHQSSARACAFAIEQKNADKMHKIDKTVQIVSRCVPVRTSQSSHSEITRRREGDKCLKCKASRLVGKGFDVCDEKGHFEAPQWQNDSTEDDVEVFT